MSSGINEQQRQAIELVDASCLVLAGAGCGKTLVITQKLLWLLQQCHIDPYRLAALTFTNKAANEMRQRLRKQLSNQQVASQVSITTFHSLGLQILKKHHDVLGLPASFSLLDSGDTQAILKELISNYSSDVSDKKLLRNLQHYISQQKNLNRSVEQALQNADSTDEHSFAKIYRSYQQRLQQYRSVDFDDLLTLPVQLLQQHEVVQQQWQQRFRHILIDEYQDTNDCQYRLIQLLKNAHCHVTAVGDDSQSIYTWRGAKPENMLRILQELTPIKRIALEQNYRSTNTILKAANAIIEKNHNLMQKTLWSDLGEGEPLQLICATNEQQEAQQVIAQLKLHRLRQASELSDYCILFRSNFNAEVFERVLREENLPYQLSGSLSVFDRIEIKNLLAYLKLMINENDDRSFLRVINTPRREIGNSTIAKLTQFAEQQRISLLQACQHPGLAGVFNSKTLCRLQGFYDWLQQLKRAAFEDINTAIAQLLVQCEYFQWIHATAVNPKAAEKQVQRVNDFCNWIGQMQHNNAQMDFADMVQRLSLLDILFKDKQQLSQQPCIQLMTIHAAKGLEFPFVFVTGLVEGNIPNHNNSHHAQGIEEERRLTYVAITRAQRHCFLSYAAAKSSRRGAHSKTETLTPSRFIGEIPHHLLSQQGVQVSTQQRQQLQDDVLEDLKQLFSDD